MTFLALTGLLNFLSCALFGVFVLAKNPGRPQNRHFFYINASIALYSIGYFFWQVGGGGLSAMAWFKLLFTGIILINVTFLHYVFALVDRYDRRKKELIAYYCANAVFIALNLGSFLFTGLEPRFGLGSWPVPTALFHVYLAFWTWQCLYGFISLVKGLKSAGGMKREQVKYTIVSGCIGFIGGASNWPLWYGINFPPYANILIVGYIALMGYAILRYRLMDITMVLTRTGIFLLLYTLVLGVPLLIGVRTDYSVLAFAALFVMASIGPIAYRFLQKKADDIILARQREYQRILNDSTVVMLRARSIERLLKLVMYGMQSVIGVDYAAVFLADGEAGSFALKKATAYDVIPEGHSFSGNDPLVELVNSRRQPLNHEDISLLLPGEARREVHLLVPSFIDNTLLGFMLLGEKKNRSLYTKDDLRTFEVLSVQVALAIENCSFIEERKKALERLMQSEKLAFIGGMAEGVAHQFKNLLNNFSLASMQMRIEVRDFMKRHRVMIEGSPDLEDLCGSMDEIGELLMENVKRTDDIIQGIINYTLTDSQSSEVTDFSFRDAVDRAAKLARIKHFVEHLPVTVEAGADDTMYGVMREIMESLYALIDNSYEAIEEKRYSLKDPDERKRYEPAILVALRREDGSAVIEVRDNGAGISEENGHKVFAPFFTTKPSYRSRPGPGIGLYVVRRIVEENHRGSIRFTSKVMEGTSFFIRLPSRQPEGQRPGDPL